MARYGQLSGLAASGVGSVPETHSPLFPRDLLSSPAQMGYRSPLVRGQTVQYISISLMNTGEHYTKKRNKEKRREWQFVCLNVCVLCVCEREREEKRKRADREQINCGILPVSPMDSISKYLHCYVCSITDAYSVFSLCLSDCYQGNLRCLCVHASVRVCLCG